jgi:hypothetical protein
MTTTQKLQATLPDGKIVTRKTGRDYKYVVAGRFSAAHEKASAKGSLRVTKIWLKDDNVCPEDFDKWTQEVKTLTEQLDNDNFTDGEWFANQWCSRLDLAEKAAAKYAKISHDGIKYYADITIIEVTAS